jgi:SCY1-like protein 1
MADSVVPAPSSVDATSNATRMGTSKDTSWAGWAISSFSNKIAAAKGEIQPTANRSQDSAPLARSASVARAAGQSALQQVEFSAATSRPTQAWSSSDQSSKKLRDEEPDEAADAWGASAWEEMDGDLQDQNSEDSFDTAPSLKASPSPIQTPSLAPTPFDDGGEPDFAGWLAAQSKAKAKKPLPKGLEKSTPSQPVAASRITAVGAIRPKASVTSKAIDTKPKDDGNDDNWGDAWD